MFKDIIAILIAVFISLDILVIAFMLIKKVKDKIKTKRKRRKRYKVLEDIEAYIQTGDKTICTKKYSKIEKDVIEELIFEYLTFVKGDVAEKIIQIAKHTGISKRQAKVLRKKVWWSQAAAAYRIGVLKIESEIEMLFKRLKKSKKFDVKYKCAEAIIKITGAQYIEEVLDEMFKMDSRYLNKVTELLENLDEDYMEKIETLMLNNKKVPMLIVGFDLLGNRRNFRIEHLLKNFIEHENKEVRVAVLKATFHLGDIEDNEYTDLILKRVHDESWEVRAFLARALAFFYNDKSRDVLIRLMKDKKWRVRYNAANSLVYHGEKGFLTLSNILFCTDIFAQDTAWQILQRELARHFIHKKEFEDKELYEELTHNIETFKKSGNFYRFEH